MGRMFSSDMVVGFEKANFKFTLEQVICKTLSASVVS